MYILISYLHDTMSEMREHPKHSSRIHWTDQTTNLETDTANLYKTGQTTQYRSISIKLDTNLQTSNLRYVHTLPDSSFCAGTEIVPDIGLLFTHKICRGGASSVMERCCSAPISKVERLISDRICSIPWCSVNAYSARRGSK